VDLGTGGNILSLIAVVWLLNLYNFMDGIDGIASMETLFVTVSAVIFLLLNNAINVSLWLALLIVGNLGFILWNWPPARIFLGDVGSSFLGFILGGFAIFTENEGYLSIWVWLILLGVFLVDATITVLRRFFSGQRIYLAHRSHAYQNLSRRWDDHRAVTLSVLAIDVFWLFPLAWLVFMYPGWGMLLTFIAFLPLILLAFYLGAGVPGMYEE
jgi:Fuc2NAc and GlcNAc transferase